MFKKLFLPALIFQSAMIGGGYATGRELVEFFLKLGPIPSLIAMLVATLVISLICAVAFEFARTFSLSDYRLFFKKLLGPGWIIFEIAYLLLILLVLSVLGAASGELFVVVFGLPSFVGVVSLMAVIGVLVFWGGKAIEVFLSSWSVVLYLSYAALIVWNIVYFGDNISENLKLSQNSTVDFQTIKSGFTYASYNVVIFTAVLFIVSYFDTRSDALWAGFWCGPVAMLPGLFLLIAMIAHYPEITSEPLPITYLLNQLGSNSVMFIFQLIIFGTFIETGAAMLHSVNQRIEHSYQESSKTMPRILRPIIATLMLVIAIFVADAVGLVALIGKGYSYSTYLFFAILMLPLLTWGIYLIMSQPKEDVTVDSLDALDSMNPER